MGTDPEATAPPPEIRDEAKPFSLLNPAISGGKPGDLGLAGTSRHDKPWRNVFLTAGSFWSKLKLEKKRSSEPAVVVVVVVVVAGGGGGGAFRGAAFFFV